MPPERFTSSDTRPSTAKRCLLDDTILAPVLEDVGPGQAQLVLRVFADELDRRAEETRAALPKNDLETLCRMAHGTKGSASTFGAPTVAAAARRLEAACKAGAPQEEVTRLAESLLAQLGPAAAEVRRRLESLQENPRG